MRHITVEVMEYSNIMGLELGVTTVTTYLDIKGELKVVIKVNTNLHEVTTEAARGIENKSPVFII